MGTGERIDPFGAVLTASGKQKAGAQIGGDVRLDKIHGGHAE
jgi:hypothetical protein